MLVHRGEAAEPLVIVRFQFGVARFVASWFIYDVFMWASFRVLTLSPTVRQINAALDCSFVGPHKICSDGSFGRRHSKQFVLGF